MTRITDIQAEQFAEAEIKSSLVGRKCWYAYCSFGNTFKIVLGRKIPRDAEDLEVRKKLAARRSAKSLAVREDELSRVWNRFQGESEVLVWCSWRLDAANGPLTSWDDQAENCESGICRLIGHTVRTVEINSGWNLRLSFSGGMVLSVLPDHVGFAASFDGNWELWRPDQAYLIGTDLSCRVIDRENHPLELQPRSGRWHVAMKATKLNSLAVPAVRGCVAPDAVKVRVGKGKRSRSGARTA